MKKKIKKLGEEKMKKNYKNKERGKRGRDEELRKQVEKMR